MEWLFLIIPCGFMVYEITDRICEMIEKTSKEKRSN